ncbi:MAG: carotenoid biosynthesis protein [candidate division WOR-3 bacterium]|nr:MAG: carotenoid biosynthesis protein [candidate division WOR-3 bacterium]
MNRPEHIFTSILYSFYAFGIAGHIHPVTRSFIVPLTPFILLFFGLAVLYFSTRQRPRLLLWCACTYIITFFIEVLGVRSGWVFGEYFYGGALGLKVLDVPLVIGFNWVLVVLGAVLLVSKIVKHKVLLAAAAGMVTVIFDIPLEIVAVKLDYWHWISGGVPLQNYAAWFCISFIAAYVLMRLKTGQKSAVAVHYLIVQFVFFIVIGAFLLSV